MICFKRFTPGTTEPNQPNPNCSICCLLQPQQYLLATLYSNTSHQHYLIYKWHGLTTAYGARLWVDVLITHLHMHVEDGGGATVNIHMINAAMTSQDQVDQLLLRVLYIAVTLARPHAYKTSCWTLEILTVSPGTEYPHNRHANLPDKRQWNRHPCKVHILPITGCLWCLVKYSPCTETSPRPSLHPVARALHISSSNDMAAQRYSSCPHAQTVFFVAVHWMLDFITNLPHSIHKHSLYHSAQNWLPQRSRRHWYPVGGPYPLLNTTTLPDMFTPRILTQPAR